MKPAQPAVLPEWFRIAPDDAWLDIVELGKLLGMTRNMVWKRIGSGVIPRPHKYISMNEQRKGKALWRVGVLRELIRKGEL